MTVHVTHNGSVRLAYETFGPADGEPLLLLMGLDTPMRWWPRGFLEALAQRGFHTACYDHRDAGDSTHFAGIAHWTAPTYTALDVIDDAADTVAPRRPNRNRNGITS